MASYQSVTIFLSSLVLRVGAYVFLRWIPGYQLILVAFTSFAIYCVSFISKLLSTSPFKVIADEIDIVARPVAIHAVEAPGPDSIAIDEVVEQIDVQETIVMEEKSPRILMTLLTGLPSPSSLPWSAATFLINLALVAMVSDLTFRSALFWPAHDLSFARVGYVSESSARILVREPDIGQLPIYLSYRYDDALEGRRAYDNAWKHAQTISWLSKDTDFTAALSVTGLAPDTRYQYALSNNRSGHFVTAPSVGTFSQRTEARDKFTFLHTSCILSRFPYDPRQHPLEIPGFRHLARWLGCLKPAFLLFLGDFIYIDVPRRHGTDVETYRREYRQVYASPEWPLVSSTKHSSSHGNDDYDVPWLHIYDDHEIANDWSGNTTTVFPAAFDPYLYYHLSANPPLYLSTSVTPQDLVADGTLPTWSTFDQGPASFFILDTRRFRVISNLADPSDPQVSMLGTLQLISLLRWLAQPAPPGVSWKFVVSSVPFTKNWRGPSTEDTWAGYLHERSIILNAMWKASSENIAGIVVISGDRHEFAATAFPPPEGSGWPPEATVHEFSCSPLSMFYLPVRTYSQEDEEDVAIKYIPDGNSKFGAIEIAKPTLSGQSLLTYRLFVDGEETWSHILTAGGSIDGRRAGTARLGTAVRGAGRVNTKYRPGLQGLVDGVVGRVREVFGAVNEDSSGSALEGVEEVDGGLRDIEDAEGVMQENGEEGQRRDFWVGRSDRWTDRWGLRDE